jgi:hypothetical protein
LQLLGPILPCEEDYLQSRTFDSSLTVATFAPLYENSPEPEFIQSQIEHILLTYDRLKYAASPEVPRTITLAAMEDLLIVVAKPSQLAKRIRHLYRKELNRVKHLHLEVERKAVNLERRKLLFERPLGLYSIFCIPPPNSPIYSHLDGPP